MKTAMPIEIIKTIDFPRFFNDIFAIFRVFGLLVIDINLPPVSASTHLGKL